MGQCFRFTPSRGGEGGSGAPAREARGATPPLRGGFGPLPPGAKRQEPLPPGAPPLAKTKKTLFQIRYHGHKNTRERSHDNYSI